MMYYSDFLCPHPLPLPPPFQDFYNSGLKGKKMVAAPPDCDVTRDDSQRRFLAQHSVAMLEQCCNYSKQCRDNVATLCCAKIVSCNITFRKPKLYIGCRHEELGWEGRGD